MPTDTSGPDLLKELREAAAVPREHPLILFGLPRWCALALSRARAAELGTRLVQGHADSVRERENGNDCIVLWLPIEDHPNEGIHILCHIGYQAALVMGWASREPLLYPRTFTEYPAALLPWRSDYVLMQHDQSIIVTATLDLADAAKKATHRQPTIMQPSPALMAMILKASGQSPEPVEEPQ